MDLCTSLLQGNGSQWLLENLLRSAAGQGAQGHQENSFASLDDSGAKVLTLGAQSTEDTTSVAWEFNDNPPRTTNQISCGNGDSFSGSAYNVRARGGANVQSVQFPISDKEALGILELEALQQEIQLHPYLFFGQRCNGWQLAPQTTAQNGHGEYTVPNGHRFALPQHDSHDGLIPRKRKLSYGTAVGPDTETAISREATKLTGLGLPREQLLILLEQQHLQQKQQSIELQPQHIHDSATLLSKDSLFHGARYAEQDWFMHDPVSRAALPQNETNSTAIPRRLATRSQRSEGSLRPNLAACRSKKSAKEAVAAKCKRRTAHGNQDSDWSCPAKELHDLDSFSSVSFSSHDDSDSDFEDVPCRRRKKRANRTASQLQGNDNVLRNGIVGIQSARGILAKQNLHTTHGMHDISSKLPLFAQEDAHNTSKLQDEQDAAAAAVASAAACRATDLRTVMELPKGQADAERLLYGESEGNSLKDCNELFRHAQDSLVVPSTSCIEEALVASNDRLESASLRDYDMCEVTVEWHSPQLLETPERPPDVVPVRRVFGINAGMTLFNLHRIICFSLGITDNQRMSEFSHVWILPNNHTYGGGPLTRPRSAGPSCLRVTTDRAVEFRHAVACYLDLDGNVLTKADSVLIYVLGCVQLQVQISAVLRNQTKQNALIWVPRCILRGTYGTAPHADTNWNSPEDVCRHIPAFDVDVNAINMLFIETRFSKNTSISRRTKMLRAEGIDQAVLECYSEGIHDFWSDPSRVRSLSIRVSRQAVSTGRKKTLDAPPVHPQLPAPSESSAPALQDCLWQQPFVVSASKDDTTQLQQSSWNLMPHCHDMAINPLHHQLQGLQHQLLHVDQLQQPLEQQQQLLQLLLQNQSCTQDPKQLLALPDADTKGLVSQSNGTPKDVCQRLQAASNDGVHVAFAPEECPLQLARGSASDELNQCQPEKACKAVHGIRPRRNESTDDVQTIERNNDVRPTSNVQCNVYDARWDAICNRANTQIEQAGLQNLHAIMDAQQVLQQPRTRGGQIIPLSLDKKRTSQSQVGAADWDASTSCSSQSASACQKEALNVPEAVQVPVNRAENCLQDDTVDSDSHSIFGRHNIRSAT